MAEITASLVKELRERTQAGMSDCKNALVEASGDMEKAVEIILKKGLAKAAKVAGRVATEGEVRTVVANGDKRGVIVEVNCQTDFVARGDAFKDFVTKVGEVAATAKTGADLNAAKSPGSERTIDEVRKELAGKTGENCEIRRWGALETSADGGLIHAYIHMGGKLAVLINAEAPNAAAAKSDEFRAFVDNCAMQIAAMSPIVIRKEEIEQSVADKQREIFTAQLKEEGTKAPEAQWPKIIDGKVAKWFTEVSLLGQESVTDPGNTVDKLRQELGKKLGGEVKLVSFLRFGLGEGVAKPQGDDLATEVMKMAGA